MMGMSSLLLMRMLGGMVMLVEYQVSSRKEGRRGVRGCLRSFLEDMAVVDVKKMI